MKPLWIFLIMLGVSAAFAADDTPKQRIDSYLAAGSETGSLFAQAFRDKVDYQKLLRGAKAKDGPSLAGLFAYTAMGKLSGELTEMNGDVLLQLLLLWGDESYARVLADETPRTQVAVIESLKYVWPEETPPAQKFPMTFQYGKGAKK